MYFITGSRISLKGGILEDGKNSGIDLLTYVIMDSHCFMVLRLPVRDQWMKKFYEGAEADNEAATLAHASRCFSEDHMYHVRRKLGMLASGERKDYLEDLRSLFCNLSQSIKLFKEAVTNAVNEQDGRVGPFWEERFGSKRLHTPEELMPSSG